MRLFNTIAIEISSMCNRKCEWCPVAYNERPDEQMSSRTLMRILGQLSEMNYAGRIELYIYNEPTRDMTYLLNTVAQVRRSVPRACIMIATNGDYLRSVTNIIKLYEAGLNQLLINCYTKGLLERRMTRWLTYNLVDDVGVQLAPYIYSNTGSRKRIIWFEDKSAGFGSGVFALANRAGNIPDYAPAVTTPLTRMCVKPFRIFNINWMGDALICCQDYHNEVKVGSVLFKSIVDLWNGQMMTKYRRHLYDKDRSLPLCRSCDCSAGAYPHNVEEP